MSIEILVAEVSNGNFIIQIILMCEKLLGKPKLKLSLCSEYESSRKQENLISRQADKLMYSNQFHLEIKLQFNE